MSYTHFDIEPSRVKDDLYYLRVTENADSVSTDEPPEVTVFAAERHELARLAEALAQNGITP